GSGQPCARVSSSHGIARTMPQLRQAAVTPPGRNAASPECVCGGVFGMTFRMLACCAALLIVAQTNLNAAEAQTCDGSACATTKTTKPLDILKFMREQAASTRAGLPPAKKPHVARHAKSAQHAKSA